MIYTKQQSIQQGEVVEKHYPILVQAFWVLGIIVRTVGSAWLVQRTITNHIAEDWDLFAAGLFLGFDIAYVIMIKYHGFLMNLSFEKSFLVAFATLVDCSWVISMIIFFPTTIFLLSALVWWGSFIAFGAWLVFVVSFWLFILHLRVLISNGFFKLFSWK
ncbi:MAG: hypothetical protein AAB522_03110 [Patescibacteria group bacterium]